MSKNGVTENPKTIKETFCDSLNEWKKNQPHGAITKLGKETGLSQGAISNIVSGRRAGSEEWRRKVAQVIGIPYTEMIGLKGDIEATPEQEEKIKSLESENVRLLVQLKEKETTLSYAYKGWQNSETIIGLLKDQIRVLGGKLADDLQVGSDDTSSVEPSVQEATIQKTKEMS